MLISDVTYGSPQNKNTNNSLRYPVYFTVVLIVQEIWSKMYHMIFVIIRVRYIKSDFLSLIKNTLSEGVKVFKLF